MSQTEPGAFLINSCYINACDNFESSLSCCLVLSVKHTDTCSECQMVRSVLMTQIRLNILFTTQSEIASDISRPFISVQSLKTNTSLSFHLVECILLYLNIRVYMDLKWFSFKGEKCKILSR